MIVVVFSFFLIDLTKSFEHSSPILNLSKSIAFKIVFLLPSLFLFYSWKGLTHPNFHAHTLHPSFEHLTGTIANWGIAVAFIILPNYKTIIKAAYLPLIFLLPLIYLCIPEHSTGHGINLITGVASQVATQIQNFIYIPYKITMLVFSSLGLLAIVLIINKTKIEFEAFLKYTLLGFLAAFIASTRLGASHIFVSLPFLFMIFSKEINENSILKLSIVCQFYFISLFYIIYFSFFVARGVSF
ncbi:MAG: hypothetical protein ONB12_04975 [candidate division KSB1 bacterium]|nr:hypothetical protein [candidate division KSB1 bacterium]